MMKKYFYVLGLMFTFPIITSCQNKKSPAEYSDYKTLEEGVASQNYEIKLLFKGYSGGVDCCYPAVYKTFNNNILIGFKQENNPYETYYKFDNNGKIIDSLSRLSRIEKNDNLQSPNEYLYQFVNGFLVEDKYYNPYYSTWAIDGDRTQKPLQLLNENADWDKAKIMQELAKIIKKSKFIVQSNNKVYFYADKTLGAINTKGSSGRLQDAVSDNNPFDKETYIGNYSTNYFHKKKTVSYTFNIGGGASGSKDKGDFGDLFTTIKMKNDSLKIKFEDLITGDNNQAFYRFVFEKQATAFDLYIYRYKDKNFGLLSLNESVFYIIKPKE